MKIIIVGCSEVGQTLAAKLNDDGNEVTVIDVQAEKVRAVSSRYDVMGVVGNGATQATLQEAGIENADLFIAVTDSDELNLLCCMIAKKESDCHVIARVVNPAYSEETAYLKERLGLAMVINPDFATAEEIARVLLFPSALKIEPFAKGRVELVSFRLQKDNLLVGLSVKEAMSKLKSKVLICTVERGEEAYIPSGDFVFAEKDVVSIVAPKREAKEFFTKIRYKGHSIKDAIVAGGGAITHYLFEIMERSGIAFKVIEKDEALCEELATRFDKVTVINGHAGDKNLLVEEGVSETGAFVALVKGDEENILFSMFAKEAGAEKTVTKISRIDYDSVLSKLDLDTVVCPKNITSDIILRYVRATGNAMGSNVETLYNIIPDKVEAVEFIVREGSPIVGKPLAELAFQRNVLVASILRGKTVIVPRGQDTIEVGDSVVLVSMGRSLSDITDALKE
ncbi:MAG: Trk system potassium transporter TrkA [Clostridia bacterium]|nr:Trk system potassium transporter TrkA [Clostridia bacterium]